VKNLLGQGAAPTAPAGVTGGAAPSERPGALALSSFFAPQAPAARVTPMPTSQLAVGPTAANPGSAESVWPRALAEAFSQQPGSNAAQTAAPAGPVPTRTSAPAADLHRLRGEIAWLELLVKKLQTELQIERQYNQALESHVRTLTQME
jgi:hypothetical protein